MRIAFLYDAVYPYVKGGVEKRIHDFARAMAARGHEVHIFGQRFWEQRASRDEDGILVHGLGPNRHLYGRSGKRSATRSLLFSLRAVRRLSAEDFDVIETQSTLPLTTLLVWLATRGSKQRVVTVWHEVWGSHWRRYSRGFGPFGQLLERVCARLPVAHVAVSRTTALELEAISPHPVTVLPIGIDLDYIDGVSPSAETYDLLYVGRLVAGKNVSLLIEALNSMRSVGFCPRTLIVGDGPQRARLEERSDELMLENVSFAGRLESEDEVISLMKSSRLMVLPSAREGFGLSVLEAAACSLPTVSVASPDNAAAELVPEEFLVPESSAPALAAILTSALADVERLRALSSAARAVSTRFELSVVTQDLETFYLGRSPLAA